MKFKVGGFMGLAAGLIFLPLSAIVHHEVVHWAHADTAFHHAHDHVETHFSHDVGSDGHHQLPAPSFVPVTPTAPVKSPLPLNVWWGTILPPSVPVTLLPLAHVSRTASHRLLVMGPPGSGSAALRAPPPTL